MQGHVCVLAYPWGCAGTLWIMRGLRLCNSDCLDRVRRDPCYGKTCFISSILPTRFLVTDQPLAVLGAFSCTQSWCSAGQRIQRSERLSPFCCGSLLVRLDPSLGAMTMRSWTLRTCHVPVFLTWGMQTYKDPVFESERRVIYLSYQENATSLGFDPLIFIGASCLSGSTFISMQESQATKPNSKPLLRLLQPLLHSQQLVHL